MGLRRSAPTTALMVPDEETWLAFGDRAEGFLGTEEPGRARLLVTPEQIPEGLTDAVHSAWALMPTRRTAYRYDLGLPGLDSSSLLDDRDAAEHAGPKQPQGHDSHEGHKETEDSDHEDHGDHGDHGDMMAISGDPSADGLVMESMDVRAGPLGVSLPGGLVLDASLDGDVVSEARVRAMLTVEADGPPDPWSAMAWATAEMAAAERAAGVTPHPGRWFRLAAVEVERAVSHLAWLHGFCRLLGWRNMTGRVRAALVAVVSIRGALPIESTTPDLPDTPADRFHAEVERGAATVVGLVDNLRTSRSFARRTARLGRLSADDVRSRGLTGPVARASGVVADARVEDPGYTHLGFAPVLAEAGDAHARAVLRIDEAAQSLDLAAAAIRMATQDRGGGPTPVFGRAPGGVVEGPRGPVHVVLPANGTPQRTVPGARGCRQVAAELAAGREWAAALVTISSFDLSPWRVGP